MEILRYSNEMGMFILPVAFALDAVLGDPRRLPHPVRWMGCAIQYGEPFFRKHVPGQLAAGVVFAILLIGATWALSAAALAAAYTLHTAAGVLLEIAMIFYCLSASSLSRAAMQIHDLLVKGKIKQARMELKYIVGRDVGHYQAGDISRAAVETVAENFVDGVLAPLFYAALGGAPLAMAYKMVNTLDSMIGYKNSRYMRFGRAAARIDDVANYIPARLSIPLIALVAWLMGGRRTGVAALQTGLLQGRRHSSPNSGYPEAAFAGALAVKLGGPNTYGGVLADKPFIGTRFGPARPVHIKKACELMLLCAWTGLAAIWCMNVFLN